MLTGRTENVVGSHIWPHSKLDALGDYGLASLQVDHVRNGLLLWRDIEFAFECKDIIFLWDFLHDDFICVILSPGLRRDPEYKKLHGKKINFNGKKRPFRRFLLQSALEGFLYYENMGRNHELRIEGGMVDLAEGCWLHLPLHQNYPHFPWLVEGGTYLPNTHNFADSDEYRNWRCMQSSSAIS